MMLLGRIAASLVGAASVELGVTDLAASVAFYTGLWRLSAVDETAETVYLRGAGRRHHVLTFNEGSALGSLVHHARRSRQERR